MQFDKLSGIYSKTGFPTIQKREQREEIVRVTEDLSVLGLKRRGNSIRRETAGRIRRKHNRINTSRTGQMYFDRTDHMQHSKQWGKSINIEQCCLNTAFPNLLRTCTSNGPNENTKRVRHKITELRQRFALVALVRRKIARINFDDNENFRSFWKNYSPRKMQNRTKTVDQLSRLDFGLGKDEYKDDISKKTGITILIKEIYQPIRERSPDQDQVSSINNRQTEFSNSPSKRYFPLLKTNRLRKNESFEEKRMEREYDSNQRNPSRALLLARSDNEELRYDSRSENSRSSDGIRRIPEGLGSDSGTTNRRYFSPTWRMEQGTEE
ncbi:MAG: hypothetical protein EZS28_042849, partial [Streblomastix strix]